MFGKKVISDTSLRDNRCKNLKKHFKGGRGNGMQLIAFDRGHVTPEITLIEEQCGINGAKEEMPSKAAAFMSISLSSF